MRNQEIPRGIAPVIRTRRTRNVVHHGDFDPPPGAFSYEMTVLPGDIDELGHANNVVWIRWVNEAAIRHSIAIGLGPERYVALGIVWVVRRHDIEYLVPALPDERLSSTTWVATIRGATSLRRTVFHRASDRRLLARAQTTWALIDARTGKPTRVPPEITSLYLLDSPLRGGP